MSAYVLDSQLIQVHGTPLTAHGIGMVRRASAISLGVMLGLALLVALPLFASAGLLLAVIGGPRLAAQIFIGAALFAVALVTRPRH